MPTTPTSGDHPEPDPDLSSPGDPDLNGPGCRHLRRRLRSVGVAIAATTFRRGDRRAWRAQLVGNTIAFVSATYDRIVEGLGWSRGPQYLDLAVMYGSLAVTARS